MINAGTEALQRFFIDGHTLTVIANDFVPVQPYQTDVVTLGVGQRTDVLVTATGSPTDAVWMRANISTPCSANDGNPYALAAIFYEKADTALTPKSKAWPYVDSASNCHNVSQVHSTYLILNAKCNTGSSQRDEATANVETSINPSYSQYGLHHERSERYEDPQIFPH